MPTVLRVGGYRFYLYSHEPNEPPHVHAARPYRPHVHIDRAGGSVKIWLEPITIARNSGFTPAELAEIVRLVRQSRVVLMEAWDAFFG